jgi:hypothetical protein
MSSKYIGRPPVGRGARSIRPLHPLVAAGAGGGCGRGGESGGGRSDVARWRSPEGPLRGAIAQKLPEALISLRTGPAPMGSPCIILSRTARLTTHNFGPAPRIAGQNPPPWRHGWGRDVPHIARARTAEGEGELGRSEMLRVHRKIAASSTSPKLLVLVLPESRRAPASPQSGGCAERQSLHWLGQGGGAPALL